MQFIGTEKTKILTCNNQFITLLQTEYLMLLARLIRGFDQLLHYRLLKYTIHHRELPEAKSVWDLQLSVESQQPIYMLTFSLLEDDY